MLPIRRKLRRRSTGAENIFWRSFRASFLDIRLRRQFSVGRFVADFCISSYRVIIEIDGVTHSTPAERAYDAKRQGWLEQQGYTVIRFTNAEVYRNIQGVLIRLEETLKGIPRKEHWTESAIRAKGERSGEGNLS